MIDNETAEQWIQGLSPFDGDNSVILFCIFAAYGVPRSYLDVGSGTGAMVNLAEKIGVQTVNGVDQLPRPNHPKLIQLDLRSRVDLGRTYELVTSIETAEHIEPEFADAFVDNITRHAADRVVFTAAMPGQQGHGHYNCQPAYYWREKFYDRGFDFMPSDAWRLITMLSNAVHASHHVEANLQVFRKRR